MVILELIHANNQKPQGFCAFISLKPINTLRCAQAHCVVTKVTLDNMQIAWSCTGDGSFKCLPYQLLMVVSRTTMVATGNGESGFDSGEGA